MDSLAERSASEWVVYVLSSVPSPRRTYCGVTNRILHRIRQHNGGLAGGARATHTSRPWVLSALVRGFGDDKSLAMRFEWFCKVKHFRGVPTGASGPERRRFLLQHAAAQCRGADLSIVTCCQRLLLPVKEVTPAGPQHQSLVVCPEITLVKSETASAAETPTESPCQRPRSGLTASG
jgi:predicted GIY-YIG superfamily endonuclease